MYRAIFITVIIISYAYGLLKHVLAKAQKKKPIPQNVSDVYDAEAYATWSRYQSELSSVSFIDKTVTFVIMLVLFATNAFSALYNVLPGGLYIKSALLMLIYMAALTLLSIPLSYISDMKIEDKYGFNRSTQKTFISDQIKNFLINSIINIGLLLIVIALYSWLGNAFFIAAYAVMAVFTIVMSMLSMTMMKAFNKFTPLEDGELRDTLVDLFKKSGYELSDIYVMDASNRTTKVNAYCTGLGKFKKIVLFDNLVNNYTPSEIAAVFAHELAHYKHKDTAKMTAYSLFNMLVIVAFLAAFVLVPEISVEYGFAEGSLAFGMIVFTSLVGDFVMSIVSIPSAVLSRSYEYSADRDAVVLGYGDDMITALKKLSRDNFGDLNPHPLTVFLEHSHPTVSMRINSIEKYKAENK